MNYTLNLLSKKKILVISNASFISGAELNLIQTLKLCNKDKYDFVLVLPSSNVAELFTEFEIIYVPLVWFQYSLNPMYLIKCLKSIIACSYRLGKILKTKKIAIVYSNTIKSNIYGFFLKLLNNKKLIWHVRDNLQNNLLTKFLIKNSHKIICISKHIYSQLNAPQNKKALIYGGIDTNEWSPFKHKKNDLRTTLGLPIETYLVAQISQLTYWKKHLDFIKAAAEIINNYKIDVHFLIVGDDLSGKEKKYIKQLKTEILKTGLKKHFSFLGFIKDIKEIYAQIDVLVHPAINEPFGRVVIEAMAMEKPVIAYDCGGPKEIIVNNQTGYLVKPFDYKTIAEKVGILLKDNKLLMQLGKAGRQRVIEKFNITEQISKMEALFDSM